MSLLRLRANLEKLGKTPETLGITTKTAPGKLFSIVDNFKDAMARAQEVGGDIKKAQEDFFESLESSIKGGSNQMDSWLDRKKAFFSNKLDEIIGGNLFQSNAIDDSYSDSIDDYDRDEIGELDCDDLESNIRGSIRSTVKAMDKVANAASWARANLTPW